MSESDAPAQAQVQPEPPRAFRVGQEARLVVEAFDADGHPAELGTLAVASSDPASVSVEAQTGAVRVVAIKPGASSLTVTAQADGSPPLVATAEVVVKSGPPVRLSLRWEEKAPPAANSFSPWPAPQFLKVTAKATPDQAVGVSG